MTKYFILNLLLTFAIAFLVYSGFLAFQAGNQLIVFLAIAILIVLIYLKMALLKIVKKEAKAKSSAAAPRMKTKKGAK